MGLDQNLLFLEGGVPLEEDFILKAQFILPVRDFAHPVASHIFSEMRDRYLRHLNSLEEGIAHVLERARDTEKALPLLIPADRGVLMKAGKPAAAKPASQSAGAGVKQKPPSVAARAAGQPRQDPKQPGLRGGKFYRTKTGRIVYGTQAPPGMDAREATDAEIAEHTARVVSPTLFMGHDEKTMEAIYESGYFDNNQVDFIETLRQNLFIPTIESAGVTRENATVLTDGKQYPIAEWLRKTFVENLVDEGNSENEVMEMWEDFQDKYTKAATDPTVQARLKIEAVEHEQVINWYNYNIEKSRDTSKPLYQDFIHGTNEKDNALSALLLARDLGVLFVPGKGEVEKRASKKDTNGSLHKKGTMQPDGNYLESLGTDEEDKMVNLTRMNEAQLTALYIAEVMDATSKSNGDFNIDDAWSGEKGVSKGAQLIQGVLMDKLKTTPTEEKHVIDRINSLGKNVADMANKFNNGELAGFGQLFGEDEPVTKEQAEKIRKDLEKEQNEREGILKAQEDESFNMPKAMKGGFWGTPQKIMKDGKEITITPKPFPYQAQAVNWISKAKRGILAYDMGMGKTASVIAASCKLMDEGKINGSILLLPPVLMAQWPTEIQSYAPGTKPEEILDLSPYSLEERKLMLKSDLAKKAKFIVMSTGTLTDPKDAKTEGEEDGGVDNEFISAINGLENRMMVVDEVHTGGYKTGAEKPEDMGVRYRLMSQLLKDREYAIGMTGTPMPNAPIDTYNLTDLFAKGKIGSRDQWEGTLNNTTYDEVTGKRTVTNRQTQGASSAPQAIRLRQRHQR